MYAKHFQHECRTCNGKYCRHMPLYTIAIIKNVTLNVYTILEKQVIIINSGSNKGGILYLKL